MLLEDCFGVVESGGHENDDLIFAQLTASAPHCPIKLAHNLNEPHPDILLPNFITFSPTQFIVSFGEQRQHITDKTYLNLLLLKHTAKRYKVSL